MRIYGKAGALLMAGRAAAQPGGFPVRWRCRE